MIEGAREKRRKDKISYLDSKFYKHHYDIQLGGLQTVDMTNLGPCMYLRAILVCRNKKLIGDFIPRQARSFSVPSSHLLEKAGGGQY